SAITQLNNTVSSQGAEIGKKVDTSALNNYYTKTQADQATAGQVSQFSSSLVIGGRNLITDTAKYGGQGTDAGTFNGNRVASFSKPASDNNAYLDCWNTGTANPAVEGEYIYSFYARALNNGDKITCYFYSPNTTISAEASSGAKSSGSDGGIDITLTTTMQRYWVRWKQGSVTTTKALVTARIQNSTKDQQIWISCPQLEAGSVPSDWSPAPEDVQSGTDA
ncbi:hypothetical protein, partial [Tatumella punctata]